MSNSEDRLRYLLSSNIIKDIFEALEEGIIIVDRRCEIVFYNNTLSKLEGLDPNYVIGKTIFEVFPSIDPKESTMYQVMKIGEPIKGRVQQYFNYKGKLIKTVNTTIPIKDGVDIIGSIEVSRDISQVVSLTEQLASLHKKNPKAKKTAPNVGLKYTFDSIIGHNVQVTDIIDILKQAAKTSSSVLLYGQTGTGKELFAQSIHNASSRRDKPFIAQNCAALPESILEGILFGTTKGSFTGAIDKPGLFEQADGGTILLDEINNMEFSLQTKLLRVLQEGVIRRLGGIDDIPVDVRIIATTNERPSLLLDHGRLRQDLYYRLSVIYVEIPPLKDRLDDLPEFITFFIDKYNQKFNKKVYGIDDAVLELFNNYPWPGNVRELEHVIEALINYLDEGSITGEHLKLLGHGAFKNYVRGGLQPFDDQQFRHKARTQDKEYIISILKDTQGNISKAARQMGIKRQLLQYRIKKYGIDRLDYVSDH